MAKLKDLVGKLVLRVPTSDHSWAADVLKILYADKDGIVYCDLGSGLNAPEMGISIMNTESKGNLGFSQKYIDYLLNSEWVTLEDALKNAQEVNRRYKKVGYSLDRSYLNDEFKVKCILSNGTIITDIEEPALAFLSNIDNIYKNTMLDNRWSHFDKEYEYLGPVEEEDKISKEDIKKVFEEKFQKQDITKLFRKAIAKQYVANKSSSKASELRLNDFMTDVYSQKPHSKEIKLLEKAYLNLRKEDKSLPTIKEIKEDMARILKSEKLLKKSGERLNFVERFDDVGLNKDNAKKPIKQPIEKGKE